MTHHDHDKHDHQHHKSKPTSGKAWIVWIALALMLGSMVMYVMTDDESIQPGGAPAGEVNSPPVEAAP